MLFIYSFLHNECNVLYFTRGSYNFRHYLNPMKVTKSRHFTVGYRCSIGVVTLNCQVDILEFTFGTKVAVNYNEIDYSRSNAMATETLGP